MRDALPRLEFALSFPHRKQPGVLAFNELTNGIGDELGPAAVHLLGQLVQLLKDFFRHPHADDGVGDCSWHDYIILRFIKRRSVRRRSCCRWFR